MKKRQEQAAMKAKEREMKEEKEAERQVCVDSESSEIRTRSANAFT